jgi:hypothetical protein
MCRREMIRVAAPAARMATTLPSNLSASATAVLREQ